jgi:hypothetical protein
LFRTCTVAWNEMLAFCVDIITPDRLTLSSPRDVGRKSEAPSAECRTSVSNIENVPCSGRRLAFPPYRAAFRFEHANLQQERDIVLTDTGVGRRGWWSCPTCYRRCAVLFLQDRLACRQCSGLHYATQSAGPRRRVLLKADKLRELYGADPEAPMRPRWMREARFDQKMRDAETALAIAFPHACGFYW